eukprot:7387240-Prymnesium_polylepis.2
MTAPPPIAALAPTPPAVARPRAWRRSLRRMRAQQARGGGRGGGCSEKTRRLKSLAATEACEVGTMGLAPRPHYPAGPSCGLSRAVGYRGRWVVAGGVLSRAVG